MALCKSVALSILYLLPQVLAFGFTPTPDCPEVNLKRPAYVLGNKCYEFVVSKPDNWLKAQETCEEKGGQLVQIKTEAVQSFLRRKMEELGEPYSTSTFWIGASDRRSEGIWLWIDGTRLSFINWQRGAPSHKCNAPGTRCVERDCAALRPKQQHKWSDMQCRIYKNPFICEYYYTSSAPSTTVNRLDFAVPSTRTTIRATWKSILFPPPAWRTPAFLLLTSKSVASTSPSSKTALNVSRTAASIYPVLAATSFASVELSRQATTVAAVSHAVKSADTTSSDAPALDIPHTPLTADVSYDNTETHASPNVLKQDSASEPLAYDGEEDDPSGQMDNKVNGVSDVLPGTMDGFTQNKPAIATIVTVAVIGAVGTIGLIGGGGYLIWRHRRMNSKSHPSVLERISVNVDYVNPVYGSVGDKRPKKGPLGGAVVDKCASDAEREDLIRT